jgi:hypothetical protein
MTPILIAIPTVGAVIGLLLGLRSTALILIPAVPVLTATEAGCCVATNQSAIVLIVCLFAALFVPQICFALAMYFKTRMVGRTLPNQMLVQTNE